MRGSRISQLSKIPSVGSLFTTRKVCEKLSPLTLIVALT